MALSVIPLVLNLYDGTLNLISSGSATLVPSSQLNDVVDEAGILLAPITVGFHSDSSPMIQIVPTDDPNVTPSGWAWQITFNDVAGAPEPYYFAIAGSGTIFSFTASASTFTAVGSSFTNGTGVVLSGSSLPGGFWPNTIYYVVSASGDTFSLAVSPGGSPITSTSTGSGEVTMVQRLSSLVSTLDVATVIPLSITAGGTGQTVANEFSVSVYGGDPTGATDSTTAIQAAQAAATAAGGGYVVFGPGTWKFQTITIPCVTPDANYAYVGGNVHFRFAGVGACILTPLNANEPLFVIQDDPPDNQAAGVRFEGGFTIQAHASGSTGTAIDLTGARQFVIESPSYLDSSGGISNTAGTYNSVIGLGVDTFANRIANPICEGQRLGSCFIGSESRATVIANNNTIVNPLFESNTAAYMIDGAGTAELNIYDGIIEGNTVTASIRLGYSTRVRGVHFEANAAYAMNGSGDNTTAGACWLENNTYNSGSGALTIPSGAIGDTMIIGPVGSLTVSDATDSTLFISGSALSASNSIGLLSPLRHSPVVSGTTSGNVTLNPASGDYQRISLTGNVTITATTGDQSDGQDLSIELVQPSSGGPYTASWSSEFIFQGGTSAPALSTTASAVDLLAFRWSNAASKWVERYRRLSYATGASATPALPLGLTSGGTGVSAASDAALLSSLGALPSAGPAVLADKSSGSNLALRSPAGNQIIFVTTSGSDSNDGLSWGSAKLTIAGALTALGSSAGRIQLGYGAWTISSADGNGNAVSLLIYQKICGLGRYLSIVVINCAVTWGIQCMGGACEVSDLTVECGASGTCTYGVGVQGPTTSAFSGEECLFERLVIGAGSGSMTNGVAVSPVSSAYNQDVAETHLWRVFVSSVSNACFYIGSGTVGNIINTYMYGCGANQGLYGVYCYSTNFVWDGGTVQHNGTDFYFYGNCGGVESVIQNLRSENSGTLAYSEPNTGGNATVEFRNIFWGGVGGSTYNPPSNGQVFYWGFGGVLSLNNVKLVTATSGTYDVQPVIYLNTGSAPITVTANGLISSAPYNELFVSVSPYSTVAMTAYIQLNSSTNYTITNYAAPPGVVTLVYQATTLTTINSTSYYCMTPSLSGQLALTNTWTGNNYFESGCPWFDVDAYGADPTGTNDSTVAFNSCIAAALGGRYSTTLVLNGTTTVSDTTAVSTDLHQYINSPAFGASTTVASGSSGGEISSIASWGGTYGGNGVLDVASTTGFPSFGTMNVAASGSTVATVTYTGTSGGTSFTGCVYVSGSAAGTVTTGYSVTAVGGAAEITAVTAGVGYTVSAAANTSGTISALIGHDQLSSSAYATGKVRMGAGTYKISSDIVIRSVQAFELFGQGTWMTRIMPHGSAFTRAVIFVDGSFDCTYRGFNIQGDGTEGSSGSTNPGIPDAIRLDWTTAADRSTSGNVFKDIWITNTNWVTGLSLEGNGSRQIDGSILENVLVNGGQLVGSWTTSTRTDTGLGATTNGSPTVTDSAAVVGDLYAPISGPGIPASTYITAVSSSPAGYTLSANATATASSLTFVVGTANWQKALAFGNGTYGNNYDHIGFGVGGSRCYYGYYINCSSFGLFGAQPGSNYCDWWIQPAAQCTVENFQSQNSAMFLQAPNATSVNFNVSIRDVLFAGYNGGMTNYTWVNIGENQNNWLFENIYYHVTTVSASQSIMSFGSGYGNVGGTFTLINVSQGNPPSAGIVTGTAVTVVAIGYKDISAQQAGTGNPVNYPFYAVNAGVLWQQGSSEPSASTYGEGFFYNTSTQVLAHSNGTTWTNIGGSVTTPQYNWYTSGTTSWPVPSGAQTVHVILGAAADGGGSGGLQPSGTAASGGGGAAGGGVLVREFIASELTSPVSVTVGTAGSGGAALTYPGTGNSGSGGSSTTFGSYCIAIAAGAGTGGGTTSGGTGGSANSAATNSPGAGAPGGASGALGNASGNAAGGTGGGGGGGVTSGGTATSGGQGAYSVSGPSTNIGVAGTAGGSSPTGGTQPAIEGTPSCGGGGGAGNASGNGQNGATAYYCGGGGGGGGATLPSFSFTATNASPAVFTATGSSYANNTQVCLVGGSLPAGFSANTTYYVVGASGTSFDLASTSSGSGINSTSSGSGTVCTLGNTSGTGGSGGPGFCLIITYFQ